MAGAPAYPGGRPHETADGSVLVRLRDRGCNAPVVGRRVRVGGADRPVLAGEGRGAVSGSPSSTETAVVALGTPTSYGEFRRGRPASGPRPCSPTTAGLDGRLADVEPFVPEERTFTISDGTQAWLVRDTERTGPAPPAARRARRPAQRVNAAADEMHFYHQRSSRPAGGRAARQPRGSDGYGEAFFDGVNGAWASRTPPTSSSWTRWSPRASPTRSGSP